MRTDHVVLGTGAIGRAVAEELIRRGETIRMVNCSERVEKAPAARETFEIMYEFDKPFIVDSSKFEKALL